MAASTPWSSPSVRAASARAAVRAMSAALARRGAGSPAPR